MVIISDQYEIKLSVIFRPIFLVFLFVLFFYLYGNLDTTCANTDVNWLKFLPELVNANNTCCLSPPDAEPYFNIAEYLLERGFVVLKYDKRGVGPNDTILDSNVWGNVTISDLKQDAEKALGNSEILLICDMKEETTYNV